MRLKFLIINDENDKISETKNIVYKEVFANLWDKEPTNRGNIIYIVKVTHDCFVFILFRHKYIFSPYILTFFHFSLYILFLPLLVPKPINACYFCYFRQSTDGNS